MDLQTCSARPREMKMSQRMETKMPQPPPVLAATAVAFDIGRARRRERLAQRATNTEFEKGVIV